MPTRRAFARGLGCVVALIMVAWGWRNASAADAMPGSPQTRPNVLWISAEDISASTLGCYGGQARTPRIDALAAAGLRFDAAFSASPVCAPSRSGIITGVMPTTLGSLPMRCTATPPSHVVGFPRLLQDAGYFCTNNAKTDYNFPAGFDAGWDASRQRAHWRDRPHRDQPFFAVFNLAVTHESGLFTEKLAAARSTLDARDRRSPDEVRVPPFYPGTPVIREALAARLELAAALDRSVGRLLDQLDADGEAENTVVFFWGDHGEGIPHGKRSLTEHGLRVPLIVRVPEQWAQRARRPDGGAPQGVTGQLVNLIDLGPTVLSLAGVAAPAWMEGHAALGPHATAADVVVAARDRMDSYPGWGRSVRDARYRYVRTSMPWIDGDDLPPYADDVPITGELRRMRAAGKLTAGADWFARASRPVEELYAVVDDPDEVDDRATDPDEAATLHRLRERLWAWMRSTRDTGVLPEALLRREAAVAGSEWGVFHGHEATDQTRYDAILKAAWEAGTPSRLEAHRDGLVHHEPAIRYWSVCGTGWSAVNRGIEADAAIAALKPLLADPEPIVRVVAARWLVACGATGDGLAALGELIESEDAGVRLAALVEVEQLGLAARPLWERVAAITPRSDERYASDVIVRMQARRAAAGTADDDR